MKRAFLFPGQGEDALPYLKKPAEHPTIAATLAEAKRFLTEDSGDWQSDLADDVVRNPLAIHVLSVAYARALLAEGLIPDIVAGYSVGAFAAAVIAGVLTFGDSLILVQYRAQMMQRFFSQGYGMALIHGLSEKQITKIIMDLPIHVANHNAKRKWTVSGKTEALLGVIVRAKEEGAIKAALLPIQVPSHGTLLSPVAKLVAKKLARTPLEGPRMMVGLASKARLSDKVEEIAFDLSHGVQLPVMWYELQSLLQELGVTGIIAMPPSRSLVALAQEVWSDGYLLSGQDLDPRQLASFLLSKDG